MFTILADKNWIRVSKLYYKLLDNEKYIQLVAFTIVHD